MNNRSTFNPIAHVASIVSPSSREDASAPRTFTKARADGCPIWQRADGETREAFEERFMRARHCYPTAHDYIEMGLEPPTRRDATDDRVRRSGGGGSIDHSKITRVR